MPYNDSVIEDWMAENYNQKVSEYFKEKRKEELEVILFTKNIVFCHHTQKKRNKEKGMKCIILLHAISII